MAHLTGNGRAFEDIAAESHISADTVKSTVTRAMQKAGADNGAQLAFLVGQARLDIAD